MKEILQKLIRGETFSRDEASHIFLLLLSPEVPDIQKSAFLAALTVRGETIDEIAGFALAMRKAATPFPASLISSSNHDFHTNTDPPANPDAQTDPIMLKSAHPHAGPYPARNGRPLVDTCGTGGDGSGSFNISTATALLCAAAGIKVAKHGNRSVSSRSGSADVLEALKIRIDRSPEDSREELEGSGFTFLFAQKYHPSMKAVAPVRSSLGVKTVFNLLGPLTNPARPDMQLIGAFSLPAAEKIARAAQMIGIKHAFIIHSGSGWDEATPADDFHLFDVRNDSIRKMKMNAEEFGIRRCSPEELKGGDAAENARIIEEIFHGNAGAQRDAVLLNSALVLLLTGRESDPKSAVAAAAQAVDTGKALKLLEQLRKEKTFFKASEETNTPGARTIGRKGRDEP